MRHWLPNDCALEGRAGDTVLSLPFHPRLCKLHLLKRKVFQYVVSFKGGEKKEAGVGVGDGALFVLAAPAPIGRFGTSSSVLPVGCHILRAGVVNVRGFFGGGY